MPPSQRPTHELINDCMPTRDEKRSIGARVGRGESAMYKWCEDPIGSGRPNPLDSIEVILDHARLYHPTAAFAIATHITGGNARAVGAQALRLQTRELLTAIQPGVERETTEALHALTAALISLLSGETADLSTVLREIDEAQLTLKRAGVMIAAAVDADDAK